MPSEAAVEALGFGDIVLVRFPFTDQSATKRRPAVVVSSLDYGLSRPDVVVMAVTSQLRSGASFAEVSLADWRAAGLLKPSAVKPVIATLERGLVTRKLGSLSVSDQAALRHAMAMILG